MSTEQNKAVVRRFIEGTLVNMDSSHVDEILAPDYTNHMVPGGREGFKQFFSMFRSNFSGLKMNYKIERMMAEGDYVMVRLSMHIVNGDKEGTGTGLGEYRLANGKIVEDWPVSGAFELLQQVGVAIPV